MRATIPSNGGTVRRPTEIVGAASRYDLVLAVIPLAYAAGVCFGATPPIPDYVGVGGGSVVALAATAYALFGDPPTDPPEKQRPGRRGANAD